MTLILMVDTLKFTWVINSVGSECYLDRVEVTGSNQYDPQQRKIVDFVNSYGFSKRDHLKST